MLIPWPEISLGTSLDASCGAIKIPHIRNKDDPDDKKSAQKNEEHHGS
jgi:hypothetical protein